MKTKIYENLADLFPLWRKTISGQKKHEKQEVNFIINIFKKHPSQIKSVIDLGGGIGLHSGLLLKLGCDITLFDQSKKALSIAKKNNPKLKTIYGSFEKLDIKEKHDAAICLWSTFPYILSEKGRKNFYDWQKTHIKKMIVLDQANFYTYPQKFHKIYLGENNKYKFKIIRDWTLTKEGMRKTKFFYEFFDKITGKTKTIKDAENQQYLSIEAIQKYLGSEWNLKYLCGDYNLRNLYTRKNSPRIITVFQKI